MEDKRIFSKEDSYKNLERVNYWISNCDSKISFMLAFIGALLTISLTSSLFTDSLKILIFNIKAISFYSFRSLIVCFMSLSLISSLYFIIQAVNNFIYGLRAKVDSKLFTKSQLVTDSNLFFGSISQKSFIDYESRLWRLSEEEILKDIDSQTYINSKICTEKFAFYNTGLNHLKLSIISYVFLGVSLIILNIIL